MLQNGRFPLIIQRILSPWLKKILTSTAQKCSRMNDFHWLLREFFHHGWRRFWALLLWNASEWTISIDYSENLVTMVEKILNSNALKCSWMNDFHWLIREFLHYDWRKFWNLMLWNVQKWTISNDYSENSFTMVEENFEL